MKRALTAVAVSAILASAAIAQTSRPSTGAAEGGGPELMESKAGKLGYAAEFYRSVNEPGEIVTVLKNGMAVICKRDSSPVLAVRGYVRTGGVYEGKWLGGGLSHLLEHLVAGGSSERRTEAQNRDLLQQIGNDSNAYTTTDHTAYFINTTPDHLDQATDLLTGWLLGAKITPAEYRREYQVVQRELEKGKGEPGRQLAYLFNMNRYHVNPARVPTIGYQEVIQGLSRDDVYQYYKMTYQPNNMILSLAGDLDPEVMLKAVQKYVADAKPGRVYSPEIPAEPPVLAPRTVVTTFPRLGQAQVILGFPSVEMTSPDMYALDLLSTIMGGGESSILTERLRDEKQLVTGVGAGDDTPTYATGTFEVDMTLDPKNIEAAKAEVLKVIEEVKDKPIDAARIERAKTQMRVEQVRNKLTSEGLASDLALNYMHTRDPHFGDLYVQRVEKVTAEQLQDVARRYLVPSRLLTTAMVPSEYVGAAGLPKAEDLLRAAGPSSKVAAASEENKASAVVRSVLDNGTVLLVKRVPTSPIVQISMYALGGLTDEDDATNGLGNFTMEMLPRGTRTRSAREIAEFFDSIGGSVNTGIGNNTFFWTADCLKKDLAKTLDVYADVVEHPAFAASEVEPMRQRLLAAIAQQDAEWHAQAMRYFKKVFFTPSHSPYRFTTTGKEEVVSAAKPEQLSEWYTSKALAAPRVLAIYGDVDPDQVKELAAKALGALPKVAEPAPRKTEEEGSPAPAESSAKPAITVTQVEVQKTEKPLASVVIGFDSHTVIGGPTWYPLTVIETITGGYSYPTGYLFEVLRGKGLVYEVVAMPFPGVSEKYPGTFLAYAGCDPSKVNEVVDLMLENLARPEGSAADINEQWFGRAKKLIVTMDALQNETPAAQATTAALDELYGLGYRHHEEFGGKINAVSLAEAQAVSRSRLSRCVVTICTPDPGSITVKPGRREYASFPPVDLTPRGIQHDTGAAK